MSTAIRGKLVVVGVDASQHAARAALWAAQEAAERNAPLHVIHSTDLDPGPDRNRPQEHRAAADQAAGVSLLSGIERLVRDEHPTLEVTTAMVRPRRRSPSYQWPERLPTRACGAHRTTAGPTGSNAKLVSGRDQFSRLRTTLTPVADGPVIR
jgi:hypothetical protein